MIVRNRMRPCPECQEPAPCTIEYGNPSLADALGAAHVQGECPTCGNFAYSELKVRAN